MRVVGGEELQVPRCARDDKVEGGVFTENWIVAEESRGSTALHTESDRGASLHLFRPRYALANLGTRPFIPGSVESREFRR